MRNWINAVHTGDAAETLRDLPESSVHMAMTSPPYFGLRDYGVDGQIGLEDSLDEYVSELVDVCDAIRHVLRPDGSLWLNLGDSYSGDKNKMLVPHRVAIALQRDGWVVRNDVTWHKPNPMPSSVKDRLNTTTEQIFHLVPEPDYWYDLDAIREPHAESTQNRMGEGYRNTGDGDDKRNKPGSPGTNNRGGGMNEPGIGFDEALNPAGKNPGDVFEVTTKPFPDAHFAVYPPELVEKPIKATAPPRVCADCGAPYEREVEDKGLGGEATIQSNDRPAAEERDVSDSSLLRTNGRTWRKREHNGWSATCDCDTDATEPGIVLDPFAGAGTTLMKAKELGRRFVGVELNAEYADMARKRCGLTLVDPSHDRAPEELGLETFATDGGDDES